MASEHLIIVRTEIFKEDEVYIGLCPDLDVSSFGETVEEARQSLQEALNAFVDECEAMGTLEEVLEEAGFVREGSTWLTMPRRGAISICSSCRPGSVLTSGGR